MRKLTPTAVALVAWAAIGSGQVGTGSDNMELGPDFRYSYTDSATRLHADLLNGYNKAVPPRSTRNPAQDYSSESGTDVNVQIRFFKVEQIEAAAGSMRLKVWFRLTWSDHRLSWDPGAYNNISTIWFNPNAGVDLEIWTPDLNIYNSRSSISTSFRRVKMPLKPAASRAIRGPSGMLPFGGPPSGNAPRRLAANSPAEPPCYRQRYRFRRV